MFRTTTGTSVQVIPPSLFGSESESTQGVYISILNRE